MFYVKRSRFVSFLAVSLLAHLTDEGLINISSANTKVLAYFSAGLSYMGQHFASPDLVSDSKTQRPFLCLIFMLLLDMNWKEKVKEL